MRRTLSFAETAIAGILISLVLMVVSLAIGTMRDDVKQRRTEQLLARLDQALVAYHRATGRWPADPDGRTDRSTTAENDGSGDRIIATLAGEPESRKVLDQVPPVFRAERSADAAANSAWGGLHDAWGRPLRCLTADGSTPADLDAVIANGGKPIFISAGPDERFGPPGLPPAADNIRSDRR